MHWRPFVVSPGDGAFYGAKIDFRVKDALGRPWQLGTIQIDFEHADSFDLTYIGEDGQSHRTVVMHRAILGSFERFLGILIEHHAGAFPLWLAPVQLVVMNITERQAEYASAIKNNLLGQGFRVISDLRNEKISYKIREHSLQKVPYQLVVGDKEMQANTVAVRMRGGEDLGAMALKDFTARLHSEANAKVHG